MSDNYMSRIMTSTKTLQALVETMELDASSKDYSEDIEEINQIIGERTLMALIKGDQTEE